MTAPSNDARTAIKSGRVSEGIKYWCALFDYDANHQDELTLKRGTQVEVITQDPRVSGSDGWWTGKVNDKVGVFPSNFVTAQVTPPKPKPLDDINFAELELGDVIGKFHNRAALSALPNNELGLPSHSQRVTVRYLLINCLSLPLLMILLTILTSGSDSQEFCTLTCFQTLSKVSLETQTYSFSNNCTSLPTKT